MKFFYLFILFQIYICSSDNLLNIDNLSNAEEAYSKVDDLYRKYEKMESGEEKDEFARKLRDLILEICKKFISDKELLEKLEKILDKLRISDFLSASSNSVSFFINKQTFKTFTKTVEDTTKKLVEYCNEETCKIPKKILTQSKDTLTTTASTSSNWVYVSNGVAIVGHGLAAYLKFKESLDKCKAKGKESYFLSAIQSLASEGTSIGFGAIGSYLGAFLIQPAFIGSAIGGFAGSLIGSKINRQYELDC